MRLVGVGKGRFEMLGPKGQGLVGDRASGVRTAPRKPTLAAQATMRANERAREFRRLAEALGLAEPDYRPARVTDFVADECRWPVDAQGDLCCGAKQASGPGQPYCALHRERSRGRG